jgi:hypothetical protein
MPIGEQEYRRILDTIDKLTAIDELAAYRSYLRTRYPGDAHLERLEKVIDGKAHDLLSSLGDR